MKHRRFIFLLRGRRPRSLFNRGPSPRCRKQVNRRLNGTPSFNAPCACVAAGSCWTERRRRQNRHARTNPMHVRARRGEPCTHTQATTRLQPGRLGASGSLLLRAATRPRRREHDRPRSLPAGIFFQLDRACVSVPQKRRRRNPLSFRAASPSALAAGRPAASPWLAGSSAPSLSGCSRGT